MGAERMNDGFQEHLCRFVGETVTIYTTSGGQSGCGFTGVILAVNESFIRLITKIGPAPGCAVYSSCCGCHKHHGDNGHCFNTLGSVTDIPICRIASFVHNAV